MEGLNSLESTIRGEFVRLHNELKGFHLRVIKLESGNRSNQSEIRSLKTELNERKENEERLKDKVDKLVEESSELKEKLGRLEEHSSNDTNNRNLNSSPGHVGGAAPLSHGTGTGHNVLEMLNTLSTEIQSKFGDWNGKQVNLQKEVANLKQVIQDLGSSSNVKQEGSRSGSPSLLDNVNRGYFVSDDDDDDIQILTPPTLHTSPPTSPPPTTPPPVVVDEYEFVGQDEVDSSPGHINMTNVVGRITSPVPGPSTRLDNIRSSPYGSSPRGLSRKSKLRRGLGFNLPHGRDHTTTSGISCVCGTQLKSKSRLRWHIHYFTMEWKFSCEVCKKRFPKHNKLTEHKKRVHGIFSEERTYGCRYCGLVLPSSTEYRDHFKRCEQRASAQISPRINAAIQNGNESHVEQQLPGSAPRPPQTPPGTSASPATKRVAPFKIKLRNANAAVRKLNLIQIKKEVMGPIEPSALHGKDPTREFTCLCGLEVQNNRGLTRHVRYYTKQSFRCKPCKKWFAYACYRNAHVLRFHKHQASAGGGSSQLSQCSSQSSQA